MTPYLLDTNTLSETIRKQPNPRVRAWLNSLPPAMLYLSSFSIAEIEFGIGVQENPVKAQQLNVWLESTVLPQFEGRILAFDTPAARVFGAWVAQAKRAGRTPSSTDAQIASIAYIHGLTVATRNTSDFAQLPVNLLNPWLWPLEENTAE